MDNTLIYVLALISVSLVLLAIGLVTLYLKLIDKYNELKHGKETQQVNPETLIAQARARSQQILEEAHTKAVSLLSGSQEFMKRDEGLIAKQLEKAQEEYSKTYKDLITASGVKAQTMIDRIPQEIKMTLVSAIDNFRVSLTQEIGKAQEEANKAIREAYQNAADEVNKYKEERMKQVDASILDIIKEVTEKVLSKSVSVDEHEKLVQRALEEAKKQKIF